MSKPTQQQADRFKRARVHLLLDHPFFGTLATRLENVIDPNVKTAITNGKAVRWNPAYIAALNDDELKGVIAHEVLHVANGHTWRRGDRNNEAWNIATDKAINSIITKAGLKLPKGTPMPAHHEEGHSAEQLYQAPTDKGGGGKGNGQGGGAGQQGQQPPEGGNAPQGGGQGQGKSKPQPPQKGGGGQAPQPRQGEPQEGPGGCGDVEDAPREEADHMEQEWKVAVVQAAEAAKAQGNMPGDLERLVDEIVNPRVPWETILRDFVERSARNDYNWTVPNRRHLGRGIILPTLVSEQLPAIVIVLDTSGSIGKQEMEAFASEVSGVLGAYDTTIHLVHADAAVTHTEELTRADLPLKIDKLYGGGGTDFRPAFKWVEQQGITPACTIYLTDLMGSFGEEPDYPVLWVSTREGCKAPWGETVDLDVAVPA